MLPPPAFATAAPSCDAATPSVARSVVALIDDRKPNSASSAPNTHIVRLNAPAASSSAPRPSTFRIARVWPPLDSASRAARATSFGPSRDAQRIERAARAGLFADASDVLRQPHQRAGLLGAERRLDRADGLARPQHRALRDRLLQHRRIDDLARRAAGPLRQPLAQPPDLAGILDHAETGAHRRRRRRRRHRSQRSPQGPTVARPSTSRSVSSPVARCLPSRTTSLISPNTKRSPATVPDRLATSSALPVTRPGGKALGKMRRRILRR